jgi:hypothetical protein
MIMNVREITEVVARDVRIYPAVIDVLVGMDFI